MTAVLVWLLTATFTPVTCSGQSFDPATLAAATTCTPSAPQTITLGTYFTQQACLDGIATWKAPGVDKANALSQIGPCRKYQQK